MIKHLLGSVVCDARRNCKKVDALDSLIIDVPYLFQQAINVHSQRQCRYLQHRT